jgi:predicted CXXCH cytochrome family protein
MYISAVLFVVHAQEIDTALPLQPPRKATILDQIEDRRERRDFADLYPAKDPARKLALAQRFIAAYPQSWFLAEAYEAAAKASIDLGQFDRAQAEARLSLRLFPENPLLLVPLANMEAQTGQFNSAETDARRALELLEEFGDASESSADESLHRQLTASARFAIARVYAAEGLSRQGENRTALLRRSFEQLTLAIPANREDGEVWLLRGIVEQAAGRSLSAASDFAQASKLDSGLSSVALQHLRQIYASETRAEDSTSFEGFVKNLSPPAIRQTIPLPRSSTPVGNYAGSSTCRQCHQSEYDAWLQTGMARMLRPYAQANVFGDFRKGSEFRGDSGSVIARMGFDSRPYMDLRSSDGNWSRFHVVYTIGSKWQQAYVVEGHGGRLQVLPIQYNKLEGRWLDYWKLIDPAGSVRADPLQFSNLSADTNYQLNCAICHTSQLKAQTFAQSALERASFREPGINCEMCHGPSQNHVNRMRGVAVASSGSAKFPVDFTRIDNHEGVAICAQCHKQSALRRPNASGELNYSSSGETFVQKTATRPYSEFLRRAFYKDGRFRETTFIVEAFTRSKCYREGSAQCASCHNPHPPNASANPVSLKFQQDPDRMCLQCHSAISNRIEMHTHHAATSEASRCVSCHMPKIVNSLLFKARSHQIDDIPDAVMTERFGQEESPNACLICHKNRDAAWTAVELAKWSPAKTAQR